MGQSEARLAIALLLLCGSAATARAHAPRPVAQTGASSGPVLITALHYYGREGSADEAVRLTNVSAATVTLDADWSLAAPFGAGVRTLAFNGVDIPPGQHAWLARDGAAFKRQFGVSPTLTLADTTGGSVTYANGGGWVRLMRAGESEPIDSLVYGTGAVISGWVSAPLQPYTVTSVIGAEGQILQRRWGAQDGEPLDTDSAEDWLNHRGDNLRAAAPAYPGWALERFRQPVQASGPITIALAPDASFDVVSRTLAAATHSIDLESFTFDHAALGLLLAARAAAGVRVRVLLDGAPVGGLSDQTRWICQQLHAAGASNGSGCWFMRSVPAQKIASRYRYLHAKFAVVDGVTLLLGSENFGMRGMPDDTKADGTYGHRGVLAILTAPDLVTRAMQIFAADMGLEPDLLQRDITPWCPTGCEFGPPPAGFEPATASGGISYTVQHPGFIEVPSAHALLSTSPESHLSAEDGLLARIAQAGPDDEILVEQLDEPLAWGSSAIPADNPRLAALIAAAQRGALVRILLDAGYDQPYEPRSNAATVATLNALGIPTLRAATGNPTDAGIHNKMVLMRIGGQAHSHLGSWNGSEVSAKLNREMSIIVTSDELYAFLSAMFKSDLVRSQAVYLPLVMQHYNVVSHLLISEIMIDPPGPDDSGEWVEIVNPGHNSVALRGYKVGDLLKPVPGLPGEGMLQFPDTALLPANGVIVVAQDALAYAARYGRPPDFEVGGYDPAVPDMIALSAWSGDTPSFSNEGDEVALLRSDDIIEDVVTWLKGNAPGVISFDQSIASGLSLQRWPPVGDSDNCAVDFRLQSVPSPGRMP